MLGKYQTSILWMLHKCHVYVLCECQANIEQNLMYYCANAKLVLCKGIVCKSRECAVWISTEYHPNVEQESCKSQETAECASCERSLRFVQVWTACRGEHLVPIWTPGEFYATLATFIRHPFHIPWRLYLRAGSNRNWRLIFFSYW